MELSDLRSKIDETDAALLQLFMERMELSRQVAAYKSAHGLPILNRTREREILAAVAAKSGALAPYAHRLFTTLFELSRAYQAQLLAVGQPQTIPLAEGAFPTSGTIACQGAEGAYAQQAADRLFPRGDLLFFKSFEAVFDAVAAGVCDFGVVPIENSTNGAVRAVYDLLRRGGVSIVRALRLCVRHELLAKPGAALADIKEIYSHEQALGQCSAFLKTLGDDVRVIPVSNTAVAAQLAAQAENAASISSHGCGQLYGLAPIDVPIQNSDNNYTRFICIAPRAVIYPGANRVGLMFTCAHRPGALYEVLAQIAALEINVRALTSCPIPGEDFEFRFFLELEADGADGRVRAMLDALARSCEEFVCFGSYQEV